MRVQAAPGIKVPREDDTRKYITDSEPVEIDMTAYYIRRMSDGDLVEPGEPAAIAIAPASATALEPETGAAVDAEVKRSKK